MMEGQAELHEVVRALHPPGGLAGTLDRGSSKPTRTPMIASTIKSSISVNAAVEDRPTLGFKIGQS